MKTNRRWMLSLIWVLLGIGLTVAGFITQIDSFWSGMGAALIVVGAGQLIRWYKFSRNSEYREKVETMEKDERNRFLTAKAWSWAGYLFVLIAAVASIVLRILGQELLSSVASGAICILILLYWVSYMILQRKY